MYGDSQEEPKWCLLSGQETYKNYISMTIKREVVVQVMQKSVGSNSKGKGLKWINLKGIQAWIHEFFQGEGFARVKNIFPLIKNPVSYEKGGCKLNTLSRPA
jgi:hypothetical protein